MNERAAASAPSVPPRRCRCRRWLLGGILGAGAALLITAGWLFTTESGLRAALRALEHLLPEQFAVGSSAGRLRDEFHLDALQVRLPGLTLCIGHLRWRWQPARLFRGTLHIAALELRDLQLLLAPSSAPAAPLELPRIAVPLTIAVEHLLLERPRLGGTCAAPPPPLVERVMLAAQLRGERLALHRLTVVQEKFELDAAGEVQLSAQYPLALDWRGRAEPALAGAGTLRGDLAELHWTQTVSGALNGHLEATVRDPLGTRQWEAVAHITAVDWSAGQIAAPPLAVAAELRAAGTMTHARLTGTLLGTPTAAVPAEWATDGLQATLALVWQDQALTIETLRLTEVTSAAALELAGRLDFGAADGTFELHGDWQRLRWPVTGPARWTAPAGQIAITGQRDAFAYRLAAELAGTQLPAMRLAVHGAGSLRETRLEEMRIDTLGGLITAKGMVRWTPTLTWDLALTAAGIDVAEWIRKVYVPSWPPGPSALALKAESKGGWTQGYEYQLKAEGALAGYPGVVLHAAGTGTATATEVTTLAIETLGGRIAGQGHLAWAPQPEWAAEFALTDLDPGKVLPDWPGRLSGQLLTRGRQTAAGLALEVALAGLGGKLRDYPVNLDGVLAVAAGQWEIQTLNVAVGQARLSAHGRLGDTWALAIACTAPELSELWPSAEGQLELNGQLTGTHSMPRLALRALGHRLRHADFALGRLDADLMFGLDPNAPLRLQIIGHDLTLNATRFTTVRATVAGQTAAHEGSVDLDGAPLKVRLAWQGAVPAGAGVLHAYRGELRDMVISQAASGTWQLRRAAPFARTGTMITLGPLCLGADDGSAGCLQVTHTGPTALEARLAIERLALEMLTPLLPAAVRPMGTARAEVSVARRDTALSGQAWIEIPRGEVHLAWPAVEERLDIAGARLEARSNAAGLEARLALPLAEWGRIDARLGLPDWNLALSPAHWPRQRLRGSLNLTCDDLGRIARGWPLLSDAGGRLEAALELGGTVAAPAPRGQVQARALKFKVPDLGLLVNDGQLEVRAHGTAPWELTGSARLGKGVLRLSGSGRQEAGRWRLDYRLDGQRLTVADTREYFALLDAHLTGHVGAAGVVLSGQLALPEARITPRELPAGAVLPSPDVRLATMPERGPPLPTRIEVELRLGESVRVEAFGLRGRLRGMLRALQEPGKPLVGDGQLEVVDGSYRLSGQFGAIAALGRPLTIEQGLLVFAKTPLDNPGLVLHVQRPGGEIAAGARVLGTLKEPKLTFFSEGDPNLTQSEIASYLVTGVPPRRGLEEGERALSVGTYIAPRLFLEYETDLGERSDRVKLRYDLSEQIEIQTETGKKQGGDIFFKFEN